MTNDAFANALPVVLTGTTYDSGAIDASAFTRETGEFAIVGPDKPLQTSWWKITPGVGGSYTFELTEPLGVDTLMALLTGATVSTTSLVASDDDAGAGPLSKITATLTAGVEYHVQVGLWAANASFFPRLVVTAAMAGRVSASIPQLTGTLAGTAAAPTPTAVLTASIPSLTGTASGTVAAPATPGTLAAVLPSLTGTLAGSILVTVDGATATTADNDGRARGGSAEDVSTVPVTAVPATLGPVAPMRVIAAQLPTPTLVKGRPT